MSMAPLSRLHLHTPDQAAFARFGRFILPPAQIGARADYSACLEAEGLPPRLHVNCVAASELPLRIERVERHPDGWQTFIPLDVARYVVVVFEADSRGRPELDSALAFLAPGNVGVAYAPGVWHAGATAVDRHGHFAVYWPRREDRPNEEFARLSAPLVIG